MIINLITFFIYLSSKSSITFPWKNFCYKFLVSQLQLLFLTKFWSKYKSYIAALTWLRFCDTSAVLYHDCYYYLLLLIWHQLSNTFKKFLKCFNDRNVKANLSSTLIIRFFFIFVSRSPKLGRKCIKNPTGPIFTEFTICSVLLIFGSKMYEN